MKILLIAIIGLCSAFLIRPDIIAYLPIPTDPQWEQQQMDGYAKGCLKDVSKQVNSQIKDKMGLAPKQFQALTSNPKFQEAYCACQGEIVRYNKMLPSHLLPTSFKRKQLRGIASRMAHHLKTPRGSEEAKVCFREAWNKAAFSY